MMGKATGSSTGGRPGEVIEGDQRKVKGRSRGSRGRLRGDVAEMSHLDGEIGNGLAPGAQRGARPGVACGREPLDGRLAAG